MLKCTSCGAPLDVTAADAQRRIVKCPYCGTVSQWPSEPGSEEEGPKGLVPVPESLRVESEGGELKITRRWFHPVFIFLLFFCIAWDSFLIFWYSMAFGGPGGWLMVVFPIVHVAVGVVLTYVTIAGFVNRTVISVREGLLAVWTGPVPFPGNVSLPADSVEQIYCEEKVTQGQNGSSSSYTIYALDHAGTRTRLLTWLTEPAQARAIEQLLEAHLNILDRPVAGELRL